MMPESDDWFDTMREAVKNPEETERLIAKTQSKGRRKKYAGGDVSKKEAEAPADWYRRWEDERDNGHPHNAH